MNEVTCPYCKKECELCHDNEAFYKDDSTEANICEHCDKTFQVYTSISYNHTSICFDDIHKYEKETNYSDHVIKTKDNKYYCECVRCEYRDFLTDKELKENNKLIT